MWTDPGEHRPPCHLMWKTPCAAHFPSTVSLGYTELLRDSSPSSSTEPELTLALSKHAYEASDTPTRVFTLQPVNGGSAPFPLPAGLSSQPQRTVRVLSVSAASTQD